MGTLVTIIVLSLWGSVGLIWGEPICSPDDARVTRNDMDYKWVKEHYTDECMGFEEFE